jgi:hypothetical protein
VVAIATNRDTAIVRSAAHVPYNGPRLCPFLRATIAHDAIDRPRMFVIVSIVQVGREKHGTERAPSAPENPDEEECE